MERISEDIIVDWLKNMGLDPKPAPDQVTGAWRYSVCVPPDQEQRRMLVFAIKDLPRAVGVACGTLLTPEHTAALFALEPGAKGQFMADLQTALTRESVEYRLERDSASGDIKGFDVHAVRYDDGLTLDSFAGTISSVSKAQFAAVRCIWQHLGGSPPEG